MNDNNEIPNPYKDKGLTKEQAVDTLRQLAKDETRNHLLMGLLFNYVADSKLLEGTPYKNPVDYLCSHVQEVSRSALLDYSAVARVFTEPVALRYGITRLRLLLTYKDATKLEFNPEEPGPAVIQVPDKQGQVTVKSFADCGVEDLRMALKHLRDSTPGTPFPSEDRAVVDGYREAILRAVPKGSPVRVLLDRHKEESVIEIRTLPLTQVDKLIEALLSQYAVMNVVPAAAKKKEQARS
ncbi:hypothetical protein [Hyalangium versicolor]|uniref:hypothetical protein n=1 Tax=Hyalangium versicolor TaxID=2861190 RepID=UPI001CCB9975|nr:hypothetical protein [Hyalangium versicolor]